MSEEMHTREGRCVAALLGNQCSILTAGGHGPLHMAMTATGPMFWGSDLPNRLNVEGVAGLLGVRPATVYSYVSRGVMPAGSACPCCGSSPTWDKAEITQWAESRPGRTGRPKRV